MAVAFTRNTLMSVAKESVYNTYTGTGHEGFRILPGASLKFERDIREEMSARGQAAMSPYDMAAGLRRWTFDFSMNLPKEALGHWMFYTLGAVTTTTITSYKKHVLDINDPALGTDASPPSFCMRILDDNREWQLSGGMISSLKLRLALENFWRVEVSAVGGTYVDTTIGSVPSVTAPAAGRHYLTSDDFDFTVNAVSWAPTDFEVTFKRNLAEGASESYQAGSAERVRLVSAGAPAIDVTGSTRRIYDGYTQFDLFDAFTQFAIVATNKVVSGENLVAINSDGYALKINLAKCYLTAWDLEESGGIMLQKLDFRSTYSGSATDIEVTTQDTLATPATAGTP